MNAVLTVVAKRSKVTFDLSKQWTMLTLVAVYCFSQIDPMNRTIVKYSSSELGCNLREKILTRKIIVQFVVKLTYLLFH